MAAPFDAEKADNLQDIEKQFAVAVVEHMIAYEKLISSIPPSKIRLTKVDDMMLAHLVRDFPALVSPENDYAALRVLNEDEMKSVKGKEAWRNYVKEYENLVPDYNFGTLVRTDASGDYAQENTTLVLRAQFFAIEIARNRFGLNDRFHEEAQKNN
ncbi:Uncharacterized conserved protein [Phaffia rhodozyma]|uniref:Uncharacterized conserved protein n=1 Tax=Phaffia rhodozyma TaxID=264483 RepID=A0A0F7SPU2_PHARH|nr:Uncharacterized conserved protein [Phaffia rhodozyma]